MANYEQSKSKNYFDTHNNQQLIIFDDVEDTYFSEAKDNFLKELIDFNSRDDFDKFMSRVENSYFDNVAKVSKSPYDADLPQFPPKPYAGF